VVKNIMLFLLYITKLYRILHMLSVMPGCKVL